MGKIIEINDKKLVIASDIHGNWDFYRRTKDQFQELKRKGKADLFILDGDLVHGYGGWDGYKDESVKILDDLIDNKDQSIISLIGNHELVNIYHMKLFKGDREFTEPLEEKIEHNREKYIEFMKQMPYAIRTKAGVSINHSGPNHAMAGYPRKHYENLLKNINPFTLMNNFDHDELLKMIKNIARKETEQRYGHKLVDDYFDEYSPEIGDVFVRTDIGNFLWDVFFPAEEYDKEIMESFLKTLSTDYHNQKYIVSGHIDSPEGKEIIKDAQLRISYRHNGKQDGNRYLAIVDANRPYSSINELVDELEPVRK